MLPTLNIILYSDYPNLFHENPLQRRGGLRDLQAFIKEKTQQFVNVNFQLVQRHGADSVTGVELNGEKMITDQLLKDAHELWVFGRRMKNKSAEPHNELEDTEIEILTRHLGPDRRIGIFVTGDHSESPDDLACTTHHDAFFSLGRALGKRFPIVGLLRDWEGPPTNCILLPFEQRDNINTQDGFPPELLDDETLESDAIPQKIILDPKKPHSLFTYTDSHGELRPIEYLPDHAHEGRVLGPKDLGDAWPKHLPDPVVAAEGRDMRFPKEDRKSNLVVVVDGDEVDASRIVVDSSFHHYLDENLRDICTRNAVTKLPEPDTALDQIAQYFGNLALWLAPKPIREKIKFDILLSLARHSIVMETLNLTDERVGRVARHVLTSNIGQGRLQWLFGASPTETKDAVDEFFSVLFLSDESNFPFRKITTPDRLLGMVVRICDQLLEEYRIADVTLITQHKESWRPLLASLHTALNFAEMKLSEETTKPVAASTELVTDSDLKGEKDMAFKCKNKWNSFVGDKEDGLIEVKTLDTGTKKITGKHYKASDFDFEGECTDSPHKMSFTTKENFRYEGWIHQSDNVLVVVGKRTKVTKDGKKLNGDEVWVGVKTSD